MKGEHHSLSFHRREAGPGRRRITISPLVHSPTLDDDIATSLPQSSSGGRNARSTPVVDNGSGQTHSTDGHIIDPPLLSVELQSQIAAVVADQMNKYFATHGNAQPNFVPASIGQGGLAPPGSHVITSDVQQPEQYANPGDIISEGLAPSDHGNVT